MNKRVSALWLPGMTLFLVAMTSVMMLLRAGYQPVTLFLEWHHPLQFYVPWLLALPLLSGLGTYWSGRMGGGTKMRLLAGTSPAIVMTGLLIVSLVADVVVDVGGGRHSIWHSLCGFGSFMVSWVLVPGTALLLGSVASLKMHSRSLPGTPNFRH